MNAAPRSARSATQRSPRRSVLHAAALGDVLYVWAETTSGSGIATRAIVAPRRTLTTIVPELSNTNAREASVTAWLPTVDAVIVPSSSLLEVDAPAGEPVLAPHSVPALALEGMAIVALLRTALEPLLAPFVFRGSDLAFWVAASQLAVRLVSERRYLPSLSDAKAAWVAFPRAVDRREIDALARTMPPASRAISLARGNVDHAFADARRSLDAFLDGVVDAIVRRAAASARGVSEAHSIHDRWLAALASPDRRVAGTRNEVSALQDAVLAWTSDRRRDEDAEYRLTLRLEEPAESDAWHVAFLLQSQLDASLLVDAADAWRSSRLRRPMLDALGRAARSSPAIEASLGETNPCGFILDDAGAHRFLVEDLTAFEAAGIAVLLPAWWTARHAPSRLSARASVRAPKSAGGDFRLDSIVEVDWQIALGDEELSERELDELARLKTPLVRLRGRWVVIEAGEIAAALALRKRRTEAMRVSELLRLELGFGEKRHALETGDVVVHGSLRTFFDRLRGRTPPDDLALPSTVEATLRPYQLRGFAWLVSLTRAGLGAALADDMGLGKSLQTLTLIAYDRAHGERRPVLLVAPTSVLGNWQREAARFTPSLRVVVHHGVDRDRSDPFAADGVAIVLTSYQLLVRDLELFRKAPWHGLVLDEAQFVKNPESKAARAVRSIASDYRVALTGTPIENHVGDLWALLDFLNPGLLGTAAAFRKRFGNAAATGSDTDTDMRLRAATGPFVLRRLKTDPAVISDLPKKFETRVYCTLTKEQASLYAAVLRDVEEKLRDSEGIERKALVLATITKLKQVCNHPANLLHDGSRLDGRSGKLARLTEMLDEVRANGEHALIFTQYTEMAAMIRTHLQDTTGREVFYLHGGTARAERDRMVAEFQESNAAPTAFVLSLRAGGTGLNLTRANHVFHFDRWWNPAVENQASDRAYRIGQRKDVQVRRFVCAGTVEDRIDALLERKNALANRLVRAGETGLTELSNRELDDLFALDPDAVGDA